MRLGPAEWIVGLGLLFGSLPGPWLTLAFPVGVAFALHDRRRGVRWIAGGTAALAAALTAGSAAGVVFLAAATLAVAATALATARDGLGLDTTSLPALGLQAGGLAIGALVVGESIAAWETALRDAVAEGSAMAIESYRALGVDPGTLEAVRAAAETSADWAVRLWPALVATALWLGGWLGWRLLGRWGAVDESLARRLVDRGFGAFDLDDAWLWVLVGGLAALWVPGGRRIGLNVTLVAAGVHSLQGLAVVDRGLERRGWGRWARTLVPGAAVALVPPIALGAAFTIGLADHWLEFRERGERAARED
ncbi:MAG: DUF2232 domain-containing protein [Gemmatimonadota bacterium]|nr:DUF2232 domain-containing protein [Gemmatimonadota bacterium]